MKLICDIICFSMVLTVCVCEWSINSQEHTAKGFVDQWMDSTSSEYPRLLLITRSFDFDTEQPNHEPTTGSGFEVDSLTSELDDEITELEELGESVTLTKPNTVVMTDYFDGERKQHNQKPSKDSILEELFEKVNNLTSELKSQKEKITLLQDANKKLIHKFDLVEQKVKTNNLIFYNVTESKKENYKSTLQKILFVLNRIMKLRISPHDISVALRVNHVETNSTNSKKRSIVVKFTNFATRMKVLASRGKLARSNLWVGPDYSEQVTKTRSQLIPFLTEARSRGHNAFLLYDRLVVDGVKKSLEELQAEATEEENPEAEEEAVDLDTSKELVPFPDDPNSQVEEVDVEPEFQDNDYEEY